MWSDERRVDFVVLQGRCTGGRGICMRVVCFVLFAVSCLVDCWMLDRWNAEWYIAMLIDYSILGVSL